MKTLEQNIMAQTWDDISWGNPLSIKIIDPAKPDELLINIDSDEIYEHFLVNLADINLDQELSGLKVAKVSHNSSTKKLTVTLYGTYSKAINLLSLVKSHCTIKYC